MVCVCVCVCAILVCKLAKQAFICRLMMHWIQNSLNFTNHFSILSICYKIETELKTIIFCILLKLLVIFTHFDAKLINHQLGIINAYVTFFVTSTCFFRVFFFFFRVEDEFRKIKMRLSKNTDISILEIEQLHHNHPHYRKLTCGRRNSLISVYSTMENLSDRYSNGVFGRIKCWNLIYLS